MLASQSGRFKRHRRECRRAAHGRPSQGDRFCKHARPDIPTQHSLGRDVNVDVQVRLKVHQKTSHIHQAAILIQINQ